MEHLCLFVSVPSPLHLSVNARWQQNGVTVAGGHGMGYGLDQLLYTFGLYVDEDETLYLADFYNGRVMEWKSGATTGQVVAGGNGEGSRSDQLNYPTVAIVHKENDSLIICDEGNSRVMRWSRRSGTSEGTKIISNIACSMLTMDGQGFLYVSISLNHEVRRYRLEETSSDGTVVAGGNGEGGSLNQLHFPYHIFVDRDQSLYVSDVFNHRVMKWMKDAKEGIVVAGGRWSGNALDQLYYPYGVIVDSLNTVYVADSYNGRVMRWYDGATQGNVIVGGNGAGEGANQFRGPVGLSFDQHGNLYVADHWNYRVQRFAIEES